MNALCSQKVWDLSSELTWQHAFSVSGVTLAANRDQNPGKLTVGAYPRVRRLGLFTTKSAFDKKPQLKTCGGFFLPDSRRLELPTLGITSQIFVEKF